MENRVVVLSQKDGVLRFKISNTKSGLLLNMLLVLLILFCVAFPLSILFVDKLDIGFGYLFTLVIFFGTAIFFARKYLWTYYGAEFFELSESTLHHYFDYRFFKAGSAKRTFNKVSIGYSNCDCPNEIIEGVPDQSENEEWYLGIILDDQPIKSHLFVSTEDIKQLSKLIP